MKIVGLVFFLALSISAQFNPDCPSISLQLPDDFRPGAAVEYVAIVKGGEKYRLQFEWLVRRDVIESGQGTAKIKVRLGPKWESEFFAGVKITGLPAGCTDTASESIVIDRPQPREIERLTRPLDETSRETFVSVGKEVTERPNAQLYVFLPGDPKIRDEIAKRIYEAIPDKNDDRQRITFVEKTANSSTIDIWLVPPGAMMPECEECKKNTAIQEMQQQCPTISVLGPADVTEPGDLMTFRVKTSNDLPTRTTFEWVVSGAMIESGQNTPTISVRTKGDIIEREVTATVNVLGLPKHCMYSVTEVAAVVPRTYDPWSDAYNEQSLNEERIALANAAYLVLHNPNFKLLIVRFVPQILARDRQRVKALTEFLRHRIKLTDNQFQFTFKTGGSRRTELSLVPPK
jgi:hypothetical protein